VSDAAPKPLPCPWCGAQHPQLHCTRVKSFEFDGGGRVLRVEFVTVADLAGVEVLLAGLRGKNPENRPAEPAPKNPPAAPANSADDARNWRPPVDAPVPYLSVEHAPPSNPWAKTDFR
jgi:hypothetical protein